MPSFSYVAVDKDGKNTRGAIEAVDIKQVQEIIKAEGKIPVSVTAAGLADKNLNITLFEKKPKPRDMAVFCRQFANISAAGVPVVSAFDMLAKQTENKMLASAIADCCTSIRQGTSLSEAMGDNPKIFPDLFITMVAAGEASGNLELSFDRMATQFEKDAKLKAIVKRASAYPIVVLCIAVIVIIVMLGAVVPQFEKVLADLNTDMPAFSLVVINAGKFMQQSWYFVLAGIIGAVYLISLFAKTEQGKEFFSILQLKIPMVGKLAKKTASARMCRTLATLISAGIPLIEAIEIVAQTMTNVEFKRAMLVARDEVAMGTPLSEPLENSKLFPPLVCHMTKIGEESGDFESMLTKLADYFDEDVEQTTATVLAAVEPLLIVLLAAIIITIVAAVMLPMTSIYDGLNSI